MKCPAIFLEEALIRALRLKAIETGQSLSFLVTDAIRGSLGEDLEDMISIEQRRSEMPIAYRSFVKGLKSGGMN
jgi:hypothetical protein